MPSCPLVDSASGPSISLLRRRPLAIVASVLLPRVLARIGEGKKRERRQEERGERTVVTRLACHLLLFSNIYTPADLSENCVSRFSSALQIVFRAWLWRRTPLAARRIVPQTRASGSR